MIVFLLIASIVLMAASLVLSYYSNRKYRHVVLSKLIDIILALSIITPSMLLMSGISDSDVIGAIVATIALFIASAFRSYRYDISDTIDLYAIGWKSVVLDVLLVISAAFLADIALELPSNTAVWNMKPLPFLMDMIIAVGVIAAPLFASSGRTLFSKIMCTVMFAIGIAEYAVLQFKNLPIQPGDLFALNTAAAVGAGATSGYSLTIGTGCMYGVSIFILSIIMLCLTARDRTRIIAVNDSLDDESNARKQEQKASNSDETPNAVATFDAKVTQDTYAKSVSEGKVPQANATNGNCEASNDEQSGENDTKPNDDESGEGGIKNRIIDMVLKKIDADERDDIESIGNRKRKIGYRIAGWVMLGLFIGQFTIPYANGLGITVYTWKPIPSYQDNGFLSSFVSSAQLMIPQKPKGYSKQAADDTEDELSEQYDKQNGEGSSAQAASDQYSQQKPNIIVVMNETFSDLSIYDQVKAAGYDGPQYLKSLYQDSILHGTLQVSAMGGGTCNSEFETLTGNSMAFIGSGVYPYETYNMNIDNLVSQLKKQGYGTHAIHPAAGSNWNRDGVYSAFGFDTFDDEATFSGATRFRDRIDDASTYSKVLDYLNSSDEPQFIFDVTLMGHSGYETGLVPEDKQVNYTVDGLDEKNQNKLNEYLATVNEEDAQLKTLIDGVKASSKPTIVLFFGDHQPALSEALGGSSENIDDTEKQWQTCYTLWANYDVAGSVKGTELDTSTSYLSSILCHSIGIPMTSREKASYVMMENVPKINVVGAYLAKNSKHDGEWENIEASVMNSETAKALSYLQYRNLFDTGNGIFSTDAKKANDV